MARELTTALADALARAVTEPLYLVQIDLAGQSLRYSSAGAVSWLDQTWLPAGLRVEELRPAEAGGQEGRLALANQDNVLSALLLAESLYDRRVRIWTLYGRGPWDEEDAVLLFDGALDGARLDPYRAELDLVSQDAGTAYSPRLYVDPPLCRHLPAPGTVVAWEGERYVLEGRR